MKFRAFALRSLAVLAIVGGTAALSADTAKAGGCHPASGPRVVYVPVHPVYVRPAPVVRKVVVVHPAPVYRPSCH